MNWHICHKIKLFFCSYFWHISLCFYSNFDRESSLDVELNFASNEYPLNILLMSLATPKIRNTWKNVTMMSSSSSSHFFRYFFFLGEWCPSKVCRVGTRWMRNLIPHPTSYLDRNLSKNTGIYVENTNKFLFLFLWQICQFNHSGWLILLEFYWFLNSNSQELIVDAFSWPILDPKFPLLWANPKAF